MKENRTVESAGRRGYAGRDWTRGNILENLIKISWPILVTQFLMVAGPVAAMIWVGRLGSTSLAGVGTASIIFTIMGSSAQGLAVGVRAMVARFVGAGDTGAANHTAQQGLAISGAYSILIAVVGGLFTREILSIFGLEENAVIEGIAYLRIIAICFGAFVFRYLTESIMHASGDTVTPMRIAILYRLLHLALCPALVFGWWIFPEMGVSGASTSDVVTQCIGAVIGFWVLFTGRSRLHLTLRNFRLDFKFIWRIVRIGLPAAGTGIQRSLGNLFLMRFVSPFGTVAVAAHSVMQRMEMIINIVCMGFGQAAGVLMGQNLGAGKPDRAERSAWFALGIVEIILIVVSIPIFLFAENVVRIFNNEPEMVLMASTFLRISVAGYTVLGLSGMMMHALPGAGDTVPPLVISIVMAWIIQLPLAYFLPQVGNLGVNGIRWAIVGGLVIGGTCYMLYFRTGRWKQKKV